MKHSQRLSAAPLKVWLAIKENGEVLCAHCNCMAGLGEVCSHVAAVLFTAEANTQIKNCTSSTSLPCSWLPSSFQTVPCGRYLIWTLPLQDAEEKLLFMK